MVVNLFSLIWVAVLSFDTQTINWIIFCLSRYPKLDANFKAGRVSKSYLETAMTCLSNEFLYMPSPYIKDMVKKHQLNVAYQRLKEENTTRVESKLSP